MDLCMSTWNKLKKIHGVIFSIFLLFSISNLYNLRTFQFLMVPALKDTTFGSLQVTQPPQAEKQVQLLGSLDEKAYLAAKQLKPGDDPYKEHAFNLQESDHLGSERAIRDTRHYRWAGFVLQLHQRTK